jgi:hypothetical protein
MSVTVVKRRPVIIGNNTPTIASREAIRQVRIKRNSPRFQRELEKLTTTKEERRRQRGEERDIRIHRVIVAKY